MVLYEVVILLQCSLLKLPFQSTNHFVGFILMFEKYPTLNCYVYHTSYFNIIKLKEAI